MSDNNDFLELFGGFGAEADLGSQALDFSSLFAAEPEESKAANPDTEPAVASEACAEPGPADPVEPPQTESAPQQPSSQTESDPPEEAIIHDTPTPDNATAPNVPAPSGPAVKDAANTEKEEDQSLETVPDQNTKQRFAAKKDAASAVLTPDPDSPLLAAMQKAEESAAQAAAASLFAKPPLFCYGGVTEEITDPKITFEDLRKDKLADFPELEDPKRVSWTVQYGTISKSPVKSDCIHKVKSEIERSPGFTAMVQKAKDKALACKVTPRITASTKGVASYKGIYWTLPEMEKDPKPINLVPGRDGKLYEIRCTGTGRFVTPARQARLGHRDLLELLRDKDPSYYYTDILVPNGKTLKDFIHEHEIKEVLL